MLPHGLHFARGTVEEVGRDLFVNERIPVIVTRIGRKRRLLCRDRYFGHDDGPVQSVRCTEGNEANS